MLSCYRAPEHAQRAEAGKQAGLRQPADAHVMALSRRLHARPTRRRNLAYTTAAFLAVMLYLFHWHPFFSPGVKEHSSSSSSSPTSSTTVDHHADIAGLGSNGRTGLSPAGLPLAELLSGNPPYWRDPRRDFQAEYDEVRGAVPGLAGIRPARFAFLIMAHGPSDVKLLKKNFPWLYSPLSFFLVGYRIGFRIVVRGAGSRTYRGGGAETCPNSTKFLKLPKCSALHSSVHMYNTAV